MDGINTDTQLTNRELRDLAPLELKNFREDRFRGDSNRSHLSDYEDADRQILLRIYQVLQSIFEEMLLGHHDQQHVSRVLTSHTPQRDVLAAETRQLGIASLKSNQSRQLAQVIHDMRGGALQSLLIRWEMFSVAPEITTGLTAVFF